MEATVAAEGCSIRSQYHHFIPRFILKNFAVFKNPGKIKTRSGGGRKRSAPDPSRLNMLDLEKGTLTQNDVATTFGFIDMYRDMTPSATDPFNLERRLSQLESSAGQIVANVKRAHESGREHVQLKRAEKDLLRRFLFIMLYRNRTFAGRYEKSTEEYDANDRETMLAYMQERGFKTPKDVWFANIRAFLDIDLSPDWPEWYKKLDNQAYPSDVRWFFKNMQMSYLAFCTTETATDEFILTQNAYSVFEGPQSMNGAWTDYHIFAPISPALLMVTRSILLPTGLDEDESTRHWMLEQCKSMHIDPSTANSCLEDLPIAKAHTNYARIVNGRSEPLPTKMSRDKHMFYFKFFSLKTDHVQKINLIFFEEALGTMAIVYKTPHALRLALEYYLESDQFGFKQVFPKISPDIPDHVPLSNGDILDTRREENRVPYLRLLERTAKSLGSISALKYEVVDFYPAALRCKYLPSQNLCGLYLKTGGDEASLAYDFRQANLIMRLISITDGIMRGLQDDLGVIIRQQRLDLISSLPFHRVWLMVKIMRNWAHSRPTAIMHNIKQGMSFEGIEDALLDAHTIFQRRALCRLIYKSVDIDIFMSTRPEFGIVGRNADPIRLHQELALVFNKPGSIRQCGIPTLQDAITASSAEYHNYCQTAPSGSVYSMLTRDQLCELWIRNAVEAVFEERLGDSLSTPQILALKHVIFNKLYRLKLGQRTSD